MHVVTRLDPQTRGGFFRVETAYRSEFGGRPSPFLHWQAIPNERSRARRTGVPGAQTVRPPRPRRHVPRKELSNRVGPSRRRSLRGDPGPYRHPARRNRRMSFFVLGAGRQPKHQARSLLAQHGGVDGARRSAGRGSGSSGNAILAGFYVETPRRVREPAGSITGCCYRPWRAVCGGAAGSTKSGGAYGFRDQFQDSLGDSCTSARGSRDGHLVLSSSRQFQNGDVQHWWHPPSGRGVAHSHLGPIPVAALRGLPVRRGDGRQPGHPGRRDRVPRGRPPLEPGEESRYKACRGSPDRRATPLGAFAFGAMDRGMKVRGPHGLR